MTQLKTAQDFIEFFEKIPDELWNDDGQYEAMGVPECKCALGHLGENIYEDTAESTALKNLFDFKGRGEWHVANVNDNWQGLFTHLGSTPKERIINSLKKVKDG